jgi:hypothetical protein
MAKDANRNKRPPRRRQGKGIPISANFAGSGGGPLPNTRRGHFVLYDDDDPSALIALVAKILGELETEGTVLNAMRVESQRKLVEQRVQKLAPGATVSQTTLRVAKRYRRQHRSE